MTTTGDLFVNIKGNNQGLKKSLNQSQRDMQNFSKKAEGFMSGGTRGVTAAVAAAGTGIAGLLAAKRIPKIPKAMVQNVASESAMAALSINRTLGKDSIFEREKQKLKDQNASYRKAGHPAHTIMNSRQINHHAANAEHRMFLRQERQYRRWGNRQRMKNDAKRAIPGVVRGVATFLGISAAGIGMIIANAAKWQQRMNIAGGRFNGSVIANRARISAENTRRDIALARNPGMMRSVQFKDNMADVRRNSGAPEAGAVMNYASGTWDWFMASMTDTLTGGAFRSSKMVNAQGGVI